MKLRNKVWLAFMILSIMQVIIIGVVVYFFNSRIIINSEKSHLEQLINAVNQDLESRMESFNADALNIVIRDEIKQNLNLVSELEVGKAKRDIVDYLNSKAISNYEYLDISIIDMNSNTYSVRATYYLPAGFDIQNMNAFKEAEKYNGGLVWLSENDLNESYAKDSILLEPLGGISAAAVIKDYSSNEIKGLLIFALKENSFSNMEYSGEEIKNVSLYLISPDKSVVLPMNMDKSIIDVDILDRIDTKVERSSFSVAKTDYRDESIVSYIQNEAMGWYLVSVNRVSDLSETFNRTVLILIITLICSLLACFLLASRISDYVTKGLKYLAEKMSRVGKGDFDVRINARRVDEIGEISDIFDAMVENTHKLIKQKYEQELMTKEAEFMALQAQINPHFLHNTLDMINWRLIEKGEEKVSESIVALGKLLRYSAESTSSQVKLEDEINNVKDYLFLHYANSNGALEYYIDVKQSKHIVLPKLTLQPIVENSITHGFSGRKSNNIIKILGKLQNKNYVIEIIDNGIGMSAEQVDAISMGEYELSENKSHIGLKNVERRIKHMYHEAEFHILSEFGRGTKIRIILPI